MRPRAAAHAQRYYMLLHSLANVSLLAGVTLAQTAGEQAGGHPPSSVETELCSIGTVFQKLQEIKTNPDCLAGCNGGTGGECGAEWTPAAGDECNSACGFVFEPFWDTWSVALLAFASLAGVFSLVPTM
eukprot:COSAG05_NODE_2915_length_2512_cov_4.326564_1_plen_129_part_00